MAAVEVIAVTILAVHQLHATAGKFEDLLFEPYFHLLHDFAGTDVECREALLVLFLGQLFVEPAELFLPQAVASHAVTATLEVVAKDAVMAGLAVTQIAAVIQPA
jgi:uncharacterized membrane protein